MKIYHFGTTCLAAVTMTLLSFVGFVEEANAGLIRSTFTGRVGNDSSAVGAITGVGFGNSGWFYNDNVLASGTEISFTYSIDSAAVDIDASANQGRFTGGELRVEIDSLGVNLLTTASYDLRYLALAGSDEIKFDPTTNSGFAIVGLWTAGTNPWQNVNQVSSLNTYPALSELIGTSPNSIFTLGLQGGNTLGTSFTELLTNQSFSATAVPAATAVPEPSSLAILGIGLAGFVARRRRRLAVEEAKRVRSIYGKPGKLIASPNNQFGS